MFRNCYIFFDKANFPDWLYLNGVTNSKEIEIEKFKNLFYKKIENKNLMIVAHGGFLILLGFQVNWRNRIFGL